MPPRVRRQLRSPVWPPATEDVEPLFCPHLYPFISPRGTAVCRWDLACLGWTFFAATGDSTRTADVNLGFYQPFPYILMASCGYTRIPVIVNGCFYRHCFYGLLCTRSIAVPAGLFVG